MSSVLTIAEYGLREAVRRKVFSVVLLLTVAFLALYWLGVHFLYANLGNVGPPIGVDARTFVGATVFGLAMFGTLFLGTVLAIFLTLGVVRGDAERGLLQPLVVRPIGRTTLLFARWVGAIAVCVPYVGAVYVAAMLITGLTGHWWPDHVVLPAVELAAAVGLIAAVSLVGSVFLSSTANGIAVFMVFGAGLVAGLLGTIGHGLQSHTLERAAKVAAYIIPFEGLYQDALRELVSKTTGLTGFLLELGPFGGGYTGGVWVRVWALAYFALLAAVAVVGFSRRDL